MPSQNPPFNDRNQGARQDASSPSMAPTVPPDPNATRSLLLTSLSAQPTWNGVALPCAFGDYELLAAVARGGMGIVYQARQRIGSGERIVALKLMHERFASGEAIERFLQEARAAGILDHTGIVSVLDVGQVEGRPYFTMPFVAGGGLQQRLAIGPLRPQDAARLVRLVAAAVQYAHDKGIVHRDIKPHNILLHPDDNGVPVPSLSSPLVGTWERMLPQLADFGLARVQDTELTQSGQALGTPSYMPPEQAQGRREQIGPASDVYGLGAVLYCLLTGRPPFQSAEVYETLRQVCEDAPVAPRQFNPNVPRDLQTICLKCLQKEPNRRYNSARALGEDLRRFESGEPIVARPVPWWERLAKWCRRRPAAAALTSLLVLSSLGAIVGGIVYADHKHRQASYEAELREAAETARTRADQQRESAERSFRRAQQTIDAMLTRIGQERLQHEPRMEAVRRDILEQALHAYNDLLQERSDDPAVRYETARVLRKVGDIRALLGATEPARKVYREALILFDELLAAEPERLDYRQDRAATRLALGNLLVDLGYRPEAETIFTQVCDEYRALVGREARPAWRQELATASYNRARVLQALGRVEAAEGELGQAIALQTQLVREDRSVADWRRELARSHALLGDLHRESQRWEQAIASLRQALELYRVLGGQGATPQDRQELALAHQRLGHAVERTPGAAAKEYSAAIQLGELLTADFPTVPEYRRELANALMHHGTMLLVLGQRAAAERDLKRALTLKEKLASDYPRQPDHRRDLADSLNNHAAALLTAGNYPDAVATYQRAADLFRDLAVRYSGEPAYARSQAQTLLNLAVAQLRSGSVELAEKTLREALRLCEDLATRFKEEPSRQFDLARARYLLATLFQLTDRLKEAVPLFEAARTSLTALVGLPRAEPSYAETLGSCLNNLGDLLLTAKRSEEGATVLREAAQVWARLTEAYPDRPGFTCEHARTLNNLGVVQAGLNQLEEAEATQRAALGIRQRLARQHDKEVEYQMELAQSHNELGVVLSRLNRARTAEENYREAIRIVRGVGDRPAQWQQELVYQTNLARLLTLIAKLELAKECEKRIAELKAKLAKQSL